MTTDTHVDVVNGGAKMQKSFSMWSETSET